MLELISLLQNILALSKANKVPTTGCGSTNTTKEKLLLVPIFTNAFTHWLISRYVCPICLSGITLNRFLLSDKKGSINIFTILLLINLVEPCGAKSPRESYYPVTVMVTYEATSTCCTKTPHTSYFKKRFTWLKGLLLLLLLLLLVANLCDALENY